MNKALVIVGFIVILVLALPLIANMTKDDTEPVVVGPAPGDPDAPPYVLAMDPPNYATDADPNIAMLRVEFSGPMSKGFSWIGGPPDFPDTPLGSKARWIDERTCVLPVSLQPGRTYKLGLNAPCCKNFKSTYGIPLEWTRWEFTTRSE